MENQMTKLHAASWMASLLSRLRRPQPQHPEFVSQLGPRAEDWGQATGALKQVLVGLSALQDGDSVLARALLQGVTKSGALQQPPLSGKHAFLYTELLCQLHRSRQTAMVAQARSLDWLRPVDPVLHALVTTVGRPSVPEMCAGIVAHYQAEVLLGEAITKPMVMAAERAREIAREHADERKG